MIAADNPPGGDSLAIGEDRSDWLRRVRNRKQRERYGPVHLRRRRRYKQRLARGEVLACFRCGGEIDHESLWDLDNDDRDPSKSFPSHRSCNRSAPNVLPTSRDW